MTTPFTPSLFLRLAFAAIFAFGLSAKQFRYFDCNKMRTTSLIAGAAALLCLYATVEALLIVMRAEGTTQEKLAPYATVLLVGGGLTGMIGFFALMSHICP